MVVPQIRQTLGLLNFVLQHMAYLLRVTSWPPAAAGALTTGRKKDKKENSMPLPLELFLEVLYKFLLAALPSELSHVALLNTRETGNFQLGLLPF